MNTIKLLLLDDDEDDRRLFADALESLDFNTELHLAKDGYECLEILNNSKNAKPDFIFLDVNMPIMNGHACLRHIRQNVDYANIVVAMYSTSIADKDVEKSFTDGANIYLQKPWSYKDLQQLLKRVIEKNWDYYKSNLNRQNFLLKV